MSDITVTCYSDVLCVWAYVSQRRLDELAESFGERVAIEYRFCDVFGDTETKIGGGWADRGGFGGYAEHVRGVVGRFDEVEMGSDTWAKQPPKSSMAAHLYLRAIGAVEAEGGCEAGRFDTAIHAFRRAFFVDSADISSRRVQDALARELSLPVAAVAERLDNGAAAAALAGDLRSAREQDITVSPTIVFNEGRQRLTGNVGYRIIEANVREILEQPATGHSWC